MEGGNLSTLSLKLFPITKVVKLVGRVSTECTAMKSSHLTCNTCNPEGRQSREHVKLESNFSEVRDCGKWLLAC